MSTQWLSDPDEEPAGDAPLRSRAPLGRLCNHCRGLLPTLPADAPDLDAEFRRILDAETAARLRAVVDEDEGRSTAAPAFLAGSDRVLPRLGRLAHAAHRLVRKQVGDGRRQSRRGLRNGTRVAALDGSTRGARGLNERDDECDAGTRPVADSGLRRVVGGSDGRLRVVGAGVPRPLTLADLDDPEIRRAVLEGEW